MHLLQKFSALHGKHVAGLTDRAIAALRSHRWPGNVRELENLMERGLILSAADELIDVTALFPQWSDAGQTSVNAQGLLCCDEQTSSEGDKKIGAGDFYDAMLGEGLTLDALEDRLLQESVRRAGCNLAAAARALGMTRPQLSYRLSRTRDRAPQSDGE